MSNAEQPVHPHTRTVRVGGYMKTITELGLTKRELFAAMMMQGLMASDMDGLWPTFAHGAVQAADALLAELAKDGEP
jgi:hypothetical protein